jgi:hypothetical protein
MLMAVGYYWPITTHDFHFTDATLVTLAEVDAIKTSISSQSVTIRTTYTFPLNVPALERTSILCVEGEC